MTHGNLTQPAAAPVVTMGCGLIPWAGLWALVTLWVVAIPFSRFVQAMTVAWFVVSFFVRVPRYWPEFHAMVRKWAMHAYFPMTVNSMAFNGAEKKHKGRTHHMFAFFPHGMHSVAVNHGYPGLWSDTDGPFVPPGNFFIGPGFWMLPLAREWYSWLGFGKCTRPAMTKAMVTGANVALVPGGFEEAVLANPGSQRLWLGSRAGFIKLALQHGYSVVPVFSFGETDLCTQARCCERRRAKFAGRTKIPMICPTRATIAAHPIATYVGAPMQLPHIANPSRAEVEKHRQQFVQCIRRLYDTHRHKHGYADVPLGVTG